MSSLVGGFSFVVPQRRLLGSRTEGGTDHRDRETTDLVDGMARGFEQSVSDRAGGFVLLDDAELVVPLRDFVSPGLESDQRHCAGYARHLRE